MTDYVKKIPLHLAVMFFAVSAGVSVYSGTSLMTGIFRGIIAGAVAAVIGWLLAYVLFDEKLPEPQEPEELKGILKFFMKKD